MKKFIIIISSMVVLGLILDYLYFHVGLYIDYSPNKKVTTFVKTKDDAIYKEGEEGYETFEIKGVNLGSGEPGKWSTDFHIDKESYLRWFLYIKEMGANTIRIYTIQQDVFYEAFHEYNTGNNDPLYLIHGVWVNDYKQNSHRDGYDLYDSFLSDCKTMLDVVHGARKIPVGKVESAGHGVYRRDISQWVIGYILGVEWEDLTVAYTDDLYAGMEGYSSYLGKYMYTTDEASPFEVLLCKVGDKVIEYESRRYKQQRLVAFSNWPTTDPFEYPKNVKDFFMKCANIDVEHIKTTSEFLSGQFASYHVYPYYPDYLDYIEDWTQLGITNPSDFINEKGEVNTYRAYLSMLNTHHTIPVVISEFGISTGRGMAQRDANTGRNQGKMSEKEQGQALLDSYEDIISVGSAGSCVFTWQDEWFKRTWNTMYAINLKRTPYWSDYQTNEQYFGLLSFDPGTRESVCYVDGDIAEWNNSDIISNDDDLSISMKYDEKFVYFLIHKQNLDFENETLYIPIDTTQKSGSNYSENYGLHFSREVDFLITIKGKNESRLQVQERYESLRSTYSQNVNNYDTYVKSNIPDKNSPLFVNVDMILQTATALMYHDNSSLAETFETGLLTYGNANPESSDFNSLADFISNGDYIEIKLPWQLLNFADPSRMEIHDDYYDGNYGVEYINIDKVYVGISDGSSSERIILFPFRLNGWKNKVTYHERLKSSYYMLQDSWTKTKNER